MIKVSYLKKLLKSKGFRVKKDYFVLLERMLNDKINEVIEASIKNKEENNDKVLKPEHLQWV